MVFALAAALLLSALMEPTLAFVPIGGGIHTHVTITGTALLQKVTETCKAVADAAGHEFEPTVGYTNDHNNNNNTPAPGHVGPTR